MGKNMHAESPRFQPTNYSTQRVWDLLESLQRSGFGVIVVAEEDGERIGMLLGMVTPHFFGNDLQASELVVYVKPEHRGGTAATRMIRLFEQRAMELGATEIHLGVSTEVNADRTAQLYERMGYARTGHSLMKRCT